MTIGAPNAGEYRDCAERVAREVLGEPNCQLSNGKGLRWGSHGSMSLNVERGIFFDHERNEGGGVRWLVRRQLALDEKAIDEWLGARGYIKPRPNGDGQRKIVATYDYADETGAVLFQVVRFEPQEFRQRQPNGIWSVKGVRQVPYRLSAILEAIANECPVVITEGEKDVDNLARWNVPATCNAGGAGKWRDEVNEHFRGADVVLIPDNDDAGYHHVHAVGAALIGVAKRIRILMLPGLPVKGFSKVVVPLSSPVRSHRDCWIGTWSSTPFGTRGSQVQILPLRPRFRAVGPHPGQIPGQIQPQLIRDRARTQRAAAPS
jgi:putative DNA primase/helicase